MDLKLERKVVAITGAGRGIGRATAAAFAAEGARIGIIDNKSDSAALAAQELREAHGVPCFGVTADISDYADVLRARDQLVSELGAADILVNCAAIHQEKRFIDSGPEDWQRVMSVSFYGALNCIHAFLPGMMERRSGRIICLSSDSARIGQAGLSYYAAAKGGVVALCKSIAQEVGSSGITVNVVSPGTTNTELRRDHQAKLAAELGAERYERRNQKVLKLYPMGRIGEPDDIAAAILYLASDQASWTTGQVLSVNGGFAMA